MGTRNLTIVKIDNEIKVAQYGQWDGYPTGQGITIANFLLTINTPQKMRSFIDKVKQLKFVSDKTLEKICQSLPSNSLPTLDRDTGADILNIINNSDTKIYLRNDIEFLKDSLFCEYAYEIDLSKKRVTVYVGSEPYKTYRFSQFTTKAMKILMRQLRNR